MEVVNSPALWLHRRQTEMYFAISQMNCVIYYLISIPKTQEFRTVIREKIYFGVIKRKGGIFLIVAYICQTGTGQGPVFWYFWLLRKRPTLLSNVGLCWRLETLWKIFFRMSLVFKYLFSLVLKIIVIENGICNNWGYFNGLWVNFKRVISRLS